MEKRCCRAEGARGGRSSPFQANANTTTNTHLRRTKDFNILYRSGQSFRGTTLRVVARASAGADHRIGIVVSLKISKLSTRRNRLRRVIRAQMNNWMKFVDTFKPMDIAVIVTRNPKNNQELLGDLERCVSAMIRSTRRAQSLQATQI